MRSPISSWTNTLTKLGLTRNRSNNRAKKGFARSLRMEGLEDRRLMAFTRVDAFPGGDTYADASAYASAQDEDQDEGPFFDYDVQEQEVTSVGQMQKTAIVSDATAVATAQASSMILTPIGSTTSAPQGTVAAAQTTVASGTAFADARSDNYAELFAAFEYEDDIIGDQSYLGSIYVVAAATASGSTINGHPWEQSWASHSSAFEVIVRLNGLEIARVEGEGFSSSEAEEEWELTANTVNLAQPIVIQNDGGFNFFINFVVPISEDDSITYEVYLTNQPDADIIPRTNSHRLEQDSGTFRGSFGGSIVVFGQEIPGTPPTPPGGGGGWGGGPGDGGAPGDGDGDGDNDGEDAAIFAEDFILQTQNGRQPLIVTTEESADDGDYSFGDLSLREAINLAGNNALYPGENKIWFAPNVSHITLESQLSITSDNDVKILGSGKDKLTLDGNDTTRVFNIAAGADVTLSGLTITGGKTTGSDFGAGIYNAGNLTLNHVKVVDNHALNSGRGGGLYSTWGANVVIHASTFDNNSALHGGGARIAVSADHSVTISDSTFSNNNATNSATVSSGGGLMFEGVSGSTDTVLITNSTFSGNTAAAHTGGIRAVNSIDVTIINSTVTQNEALINEGGISAHGGSTILVHNSILAGNTDPHASSVDDTAGGISSASTHNLVGITDESFFINELNNNDHIGSAAPGLAPLADYGGFTMTHALLVGSPAIDSANSSLAVTTYGLVLDQRGKNRHIGTQVDKGSYERGNVPNDYTLVVSTSADENDTDWTPGDLSLREAIDLVDQIDGEATIVFDMDSVGSSIELSLGTLVIDDNMTIEGPGTSSLTIEGSISSIGVPVIIISNAVVAIEGVSITGGNGGGGLGAGNADVTLTNVRVHGNTSAEGIGGVGVGGGSLTLIDSTIDENNGMLAGGLMVTSGADLTISGSTINNNSATIAAGIALDSTGDLKIVNSTISGNEGGDHGAIYVSAASSVEIINSTIASNSASPESADEFYTAGIFAAGVVTLHNTIVADNSVGGQFGTPLTYRDVLVWGSGSFSSSSSRNLIKSDPEVVFPTFNNLIGYDPKLSALGDWGGPTKTHKLLSGSDAIDEGSNSIITAYDLEFDQRGLDRIDDLVGVVDIGAVESVFDDF